MKKLGLLLVGLLLEWGNVTAREYILENDYLAREITLTPYLRTSAIVNKQMPQTLAVPASDEFMLRVSEGTDKVGTDRWLTSRDFVVKSHQTYSLPGKGQGLKVLLERKDFPLRVTVHYELPDGRPYLYKYLEITSDRTLTLERVDVDVLYLEGAYQPYQEKEMTAQAPARWRPGLGQPVYDYLNATFWGMEFPAAYNTVVEQELKLGYLWGKQLTPSQTYTTYKSVMGVADDAAFIDEAFFDYIDAIRIRPRRCQLQYNSWFDLGKSVNEETFLAAARLIHQELVEKRGIRPLDAYVIDDGWQQMAPDQLAQTQGVWVINEKFSPDFGRIHQAMQGIGSKLGLWLSPGSFFGSRPQVEALRKKGYEALSLSMSMAGPKYMDLLEQRILELTRQGVAYFKFDGLFGHLNIRDFELNGRGVPRMPQLKTDGWPANDARLNDPVYDELKTYYLVAGTERLMQLMKHQHAINPQVFTAITNGAYLSPWWLQYTDVVWLINCGDAAGDSNRNDELVYRDGVYYSVFRQEQTKFPINSIWNHEPKKTKTGEPAAVFRDYLFMHLSRGTGFVELYLKPKLLSSSDWDVLAEGIKWWHSVFPAFRHVRMVGGDPRAKQVYGYSGWMDKMGYLSLHNPSDQVRTFRLVLNREIGVPASIGQVALSSPIKGDAAGLPSQWNYGDTLRLELQPKEIRILSFYQK